MPEFLTETGEFTEEFRTGLPDMLGEEHEGSKVFDDIPNIAALVKSHADTKSALGKKLDNVIQKPAADASEEDKKAYQALLATELGAPADASEYEFFKPEKLPEGMEMDKALEDKFRQFFFENKVPKSLVLALSKVFAETQIENFTTVTEADKQAAETAKQDEAKKADEAQRLFDEDCAKLRTENPGDKLAVFARVSLASILKYGEPALIAKLKAAEMYKNATDLNKWRQCGVSIGMLRGHNKIGLETLDASVLGGAGGGSPAGEKKSMYARTKKQLGET